MIDSHRQFPSRLVNFPLLQRQELSYWRYKNKVSTTQLFCFVTIEEEEAPSPDYKSSICVFMRVETHGFICWVGNDMKNGSTGRLWICRSDDTGCTILFGHLNDPIAQSEEPHNCRFNIYRIEIAVLNCAK